MYMRRGNKAGLINLLIYLLGSQKKKKKKKKIKNKNKKK